MLRFSKSLLALASLVLCFSPAPGAEAEEGAKPATEFPSPDRRFAFRYAQEAGEKATGYDLIDQRSGAPLARVAEPDDSIGASARFNTTVKWKPDSGAFALEAQLWKRGRDLKVYRRDGATFREVELPELTVEISERAGKGKRFPHVVSVNMVSAKRWQKDGSLVAEIESSADGEGYLITTTRTVVLGFASSGPAKIRTSIVRSKLERQ